MHAARYSHILDISFCWSIGMLMQIHRLSYLIRIIALLRELILMYWMDEASHYLIYKKSTSLLGSNDDGIVNESNDSILIAYQTPQEFLNLVLHLHDLLWLNIHKVNLLMHLSSSNDNMGGNYLLPSCYDMCYCIIVFATVCHVACSVSLFWSIFLWFHIHLWMQCPLSSLLLTSKIDLYISQFFCWA